MAVVTSNQYDQDPNNPSGGAQSTTSGGNGAGVTTVVSGSKGGGGGASSNAAPTVQNAQGSQNSAPATPSSSGSFTNLKNYLNANNNGQNFTGQINNNLSQQGQQLQSSVNNASQQFNQQAQQVVNPLQTAYQNFQQNGGASGDANQITNYAKQSPDNVSSVKSLENASYTGPKSLNDLSGTNNGAAIQSNINNYSSLANNAGTEAGRFNLLQNMFGGQGYTQGQQTLDNMFIDPSQLYNARSSANQVQNAYNQAVNNVANQTQNFQNQVGTMANSTVNTLNNALSGPGNNSVVGNIGTEYRNALSTQDAALKAAQDSFTSGNITAEQAQALGLTNNENVYNTLANPNAYISANAGYSPADAASSNDYANIAALSNLLGTNANGASAQALAQYGTSAPVTRQDLVNYNAAQLATDIANAQNSWQNQSHDLVQQLGQTEFNGGNDLNKQVNFDPNSINNIGVNGINQATFDYVNSLYNSTANNPTQYLQQFAQDIANHMGTSYENALNGELSYGTGQTGVTNWAQRGNGNDPYAQAMENLVQSYNQYNPNKTINVTPNS